VLVVQTQTANIRPLIQVVQQVEVTAGYALEEVEEEVQVEGENKGAYDTGVKYRERSTSGTEVPLGNRCQESLYVTEGVDDEG
jgi:hypothetical protein